MKFVQFAGVFAAGAAAAVWLRAVAPVTDAGTAKPADSPTRAVLYYRDPMHPAYTSDKPGKAPDCGMELVPVYAVDSKAAPAALGSLDSGLVRISPEQRAMMGLRTGRVEKSRVAQTVRTYGRVALDEDRVFSLTTGGDGSVQQIFAGTATGNVVHKGQSLVSVYGREYATAQRSLYAMRSVENPPPTPPDNPQDQPATILREARLVLQNLGVGEAQIQQLTQTRQIMLDTILTAPVTGVIVARNAFQKQNFDRGVELFRIADLSQVWIVADMFGQDARDVRSGGTAKVSVPSRPEATVSGTVDEALPRVDGDSRTTRLRLRATNPGLILRPDMVVDLEFPISLPEAITIPAEAVIESGVRKTVFVERGDGAFEPRAVQTGWRFGDRVQVVNGLEAGDSIVISGSFLIESESQMHRGDPHVHD